LINIVLRLSYHFYTAISIKKRKKPIRGGEGSAFPQTFRLEKREVYVHEMFKMNMELFVCPHLTVFIRSGRDS